jgi:hypothetical protein
VNKINWTERIIMATRPPVISNNQSAASYINKKGINELFEVEFLDKKQKYRRISFSFLGHNDSSHG